MISPGRALVASVLAATAGLAVAQDRPPQDRPPKESSPGATQGQPAVSATKSTVRHYITGTLVAFDVEKGTITFKDESEKRLTWPIEMRLVEHARNYAAMRLQTLKAGDRVAVIYIGNAGEERVTDVRPFRPRQRPEGQDRLGATPTSPAPPQ